MGIHVLQVVAKVGERDTNSGQGGGGIGGSGTLLQRTRTRTRDIDRLSVAVVVCLFWNALYVFMYHQSPLCQSAGPQGARPRVKAVPEQPYAG